MTAHDQPPAPMSSPAPTTEHRPAAGPPQAPSVPLPPAGTGYPPMGLPTSPPVVNHLPPSRHTNGFAMAAFVLSLLGGVLLAVVFAFIALSQIKARREQGKGLAVAALAITGAWLLGAVALVTALAVAGPDRDGSGAVVETGTAHTLDLRAGDCFDEPDEDIGTVSVVPCGSPHFAEVYWEVGVTAANDRHPGEREVLRQADRRCEHAFTWFVGEYYAESPLDIYYFYPSQGSWAEGDRTITCAVFDPAGQTTGSLRSARPASSADGSG